jgi:outer membrane protein assembly factor BamB
MTYNNEQFQPEIVDEQLSQLSQPLIATSRTQQTWDNRTNRRFVQHLHRSYHEISAGDGRSLERAWERIAQQLHTEEDISMPELQLQHTLPGSLPVPVRRQTIFQRLGLLVAVLFLIALVGSLVVVLDMAHNAGMSNNHLAAKAVATHTPQLYLYVVSNKAVYKLDDQSGHSIWSNALGNLAVEPTIVSNGVIYAVHQDNPLSPQEHETVDALSTAGGKILWQFKGNNGDYLLALASTSGIAYISVSTPSASYVYALNATNGHLLWKYIVGYSANRVVVANGIVYGSGETDMYQTNGVIYALNATTGAQLWRVEGKTENIYITQIVNSVAYGYSARDDKGANPPERYSYIYAFNAQNGASLWRSSIIHQYLPADPVLTNGVIYFGTDELGTAGPLVYAMNAANGTILWTKKVGGPISSPVIVLNGVVYVSTHTNSSQAPSPVVALDASDGSIRWTHQLTNNFAQLSVPLNIANNMLYIVTSDNILHMLSLANGNELHAIRLPSPANFFFSDVFTLAP